MTLTAVFERFMTTPRMHFIAFGSYCLLSDFVNDY